MYNKQLSEKDKAKVDTKTKYVIDEIRKQLGILVGCVKQGTGSTNDGNTTRKFYQKTACYSTSSSIKMCN